MTAAKDRSLAGLTECGCCEGREIAVPAQIHNRPGLKAIAYRIGTHGKFKESLLARLSGADFPALQQLTTRDDDDFTIGLLDAWSVVADILTFYQERIANESFLRTATETLSIQELARLTGYALSPGVAATAYMAFTLEEPPATAGSSVSLAVSAALRQAAATVPESVTIAAGTKVQSIPGQDEEAQIFETTQAITARPKWNKIRPELKQKQTIDAKTSSSLLLDGVSLQLKPGDRLLLIAGGKQALRQIVEAKEDSTEKTTKVKLITEESEFWIAGLVASTLPMTIASLGSSTSSSLPTGISSYGIAAAASAGALTGVVPGVFTILQTPQVFVMRARASLFGHNAPAFGLLPEETRTTVYGASSTATEWPFTSKTSKVLDLDSVYSKIVPGSWAVIAIGGDPDNATFAEVKDVRDTTAAGYGMSAKTTQLTLDQAITVSSMSSLRKMVAYVESEELTLADLPRTDAVSGNTIELEQTIDGLQTGQNLILSGELKSSGTYASELITIQSTSKSKNRTVLSLKSGLIGKYDRDTVTINGNVAPASHGETVSEILGSGDATQAFQSFKLKQKPLTYLTDTNPSGGVSTLKVYVNDVLWKEVENLLDSEPEDRHYVIVSDVEGKTKVQFGDGKNGARLPTGQNNVTATYRKGIGLDGRVKKDQLSLLLTRSYGLKEVTNPIDADGGDDPETSALARSNAPLKVRTLGRAVSLKDHEDFARGFSGIAKALATWTWFGDRKGVFLTVAPSQKKTSTSSSSSSTLLKSLGDALAKAGPPYVRFQIKPYRPVTFKLALRVKILAEYKEDKVKTAVKAALRDAFSFANRSFGQPVFLSEVMSVVQGVTGVGGVDVDKLYRSGEEAKWNDRLLAAGPETSQSGSLLGAELLILDSGELDELGVMQ